MPRKAATATATGHTGGNGGSSAKAKKRPRALMGHRHSEKSGKVKSKSHQYLDVPMLVWAVATAQEASSEVLYDLGDLLDGHV